MVEEVDTVIIAAIANKNIMIMHSPKNFGGTRTRPDNKAICMFGIGSLAVSILIDLNSALAKCNIIVSVVQELSGYKTVLAVANIPAPGDIGLIRFKGSAIFIPGPVLRNTVLMSNTADPFELIPLIMSMARTFDLENVSTGDMRGNVVTHADDFNAWLYGVCLGTIRETRYFIVPNDREIILFNNKRHPACIA